MRQKKVQIAHRLIGQLFKMANLSQLSLEAAVRLVAGETLSLYGRFALFSTQSVSFHTLFPAPAPNSAPARSLPLGPAPAPTLN